MYRHLAICIWLLFVAFPARAAEPVVTLVNDLESCVALSNGSLVRHGNVLLYQVQLEVFASTGNCGCRSMWGSYQVRNGPQVVRYEDLLLKESRQAFLFVESDEGVLENEEITIGLGCKGS
ncbi:MAG: DUF2195 family protein [Pseudomonas sp.]|uniref:DUF2195 family protein n=1 Tax=Pseudomonas sp. TaxID=306 RepID=UPI0033991DD9